MDGNGGNDSTPLKLSNFSFATESPWLGFDVATMERHSRARVLQSRQRAERLRRSNIALAHLLEVAKAQRRFEIDLRRMEIRESRQARLRALTHHEELSEAEPETIDLNRRPEPDIDLRREPLAKPISIFVDRQPRGAASARRWG